LRETDRKVGTEIRNEEGEVRRKGEERKGGKGRGV